MMISSERSSLDLWEFSLFQIKIYFCIFKNQFLGEKCKIIERWKYFETHCIFFPIFHLKIDLYKNIFLMK